MSILNKKQKIFGDIAAARTLTDSMPKLKLSSSLASINNNGNIILFLTDLVKSLIGYQELVKVITDILTTSMDEVERVIKKALRTELKSIVSCGINPSLPAFIKSTGAGVVIEVKKIDFYDMLKTDPNSPSGNLMYDNVTPTYLNSTDFNTFLYGVLQNTGTNNSWKGILDFTFIATSSNSAIPNNSLIIKANQNYNTKSLNDLNNDFINSLSLFNASKMVNKIIDIIFGSISINVRKTSKQLEAEAKIDAIVDKIINSDCGDDYDDSFFEFDNEELAEIEARANERKNGIIKYKTSEEMNVSVPQASLTTLSTELGTAVTIQQKREILGRNLDNMAEITAQNTNKQDDKVSIKLNFSQLIITNFIKAIVSFILSPKVVCIFLINYKIVYGNGSNFVDGLDFIKKTKKLVTNVIKKITETIVKKLVVKVSKEIATLMAAVQAKKLIEKNKAQTSQLLSLVGVPQDVIRIIKGLV